MHHNEEHLSSRFSQRQPTVLILRMVYIGLNQQEGVAKDSGCFLEIDAMLDQIERSL